MQINDAFLAASLFLFALPASLGFSQESAQTHPTGGISPGNLENQQSLETQSASKPAVGKHRFEPSASHAYRVQRAREESQARRELLWRYQANGLNYAQPTFDGMALHPYPVSRRWHFVKPVRPW